MFFHCPLYDREGDYDAAEHARTGVYNIYRPQRSGIGARAVKLIISPPFGLFRHAGLAAFSMRDMALHASLIGARAFFISRYFAIYFAISLTRAASRRAMPPASLRADERLAIIAQAPGRYAAAIRCCRDNLCCAHAYSADANIDALR